MLRVDQVHVIRHKVLQEGRSIRSVARELGVSRNSVRKYKREPEPVRKSGRPKPRPVTDAVRPRLEALVADWGARTTAKQRITATRLHRELVAEGFVVGLTTVQTLWREHRRQRQEVFVPLVHRPGEEAQVDFFEVTVEVDGERRRVWKLLIRLMHSGRDFAWLYPRGDQVAFLDGHVRAFAHFGGVPQRCVYDNLSAAVRKVMLPRRELTERFQALVNHYSFTPCFARPGVGHDKGGVESRGKGIRLQYLTPIPRGATLQAVSEELLQALDRHADTSRDRAGRSVSERFVEESAHLRALPARPFAARRVVLCSVSRSAQVKVEGAVYSVPSHWHGLSATAYVGPEEVEVVCRGESETHPRQHRGGQSIRYRHFLPELSRKPQALQQVMEELLRELAPPYAAFWRLLVGRHGPSDAARTFARALEAVCEHGDAKVTAALQDMIAAGQTKVLRLRDREPKPAPVRVPAALAGVQVEAPSAASFDALLAEASSRD